MQTVGQDTGLDVRQLPVKKELKGSRQLGVFMVIFASFWGGVPTATLVASLLDGTFKAAMLMVLFFTVIGFGLFLIGLNQFFIRGRIEITAKKVTFWKKNLFRDRHWMEPVKNYAGIMSRSEFHSGGKNQSSYTLHIIELYHEDKKKKVVLHQSKSSVGVRALWEDYCRAMNLPALAESEDGLNRREVDDLDKSVRELVAEEKLTFDFDPAQKPPEGLSLSVDDDRLDVTIKRKKGFNPIGWLLMVAIPGVFIYVGFFVDDAPFVFGIVGILFEFIFIGAGVWHLITKPHLRLSREEVHISMITPWGETAGTRIRTNDIEQIYIKKIENSGMKAVVIVSDQQHKPIGMGLNTETLEWLKNCILTVISAPQR